MGAQGILCYDTQGDSLRQVQIKTVEGRSPKGMILSVKANTKGVLFFWKRMKAYIVMIPKLVGLNFIPLQI